MITAGELTERITIEQPAKGQNEVGETTLAWSTFASAWAKVVPLAGREAERYAEVVGLSGHKVTIRAVPGLSTAMRVIYRGRTLEIGAINEYERIWYLELICTEKAPS
ncbi:MAG: head-tail adaptor protein [Caulobacteraceae bacterium]|nr:head-tail adaptor protein [Caulobacteraceae bacterium]